MGRKLLAYSVFVCLIALVAIGCGGGGGGGSAVVNPVSVPINSGSVANLTGVVSLENKPVANAKVFLYPSDKAFIAGIVPQNSFRANIIAQTLNGDGSYSTFTDASGRYTFTGVPVGNYTLIAARDQSHQFAKTNVILGAVTQQDAVLTPTGSVTGRVQMVVENVTENISGAIVYLEGTSYVAISGLDGTFTIANVPANQSFNLKVLSSLGTPTTSPAVTITPGSSYNAGTILLSAPQVITSTLSGQVIISEVAAPDPALAGHMVLLTAENNSPLINLTDQNGNFAFILRKGGNYRVTPIPEEHSVMPLFQNILVTLGEDTALPEAFSLQAEPADKVLFAVDGSLTKASKAFNEADDGGVPLTLSETSTGKVFAAITNADGSYNFEVPPGEYELAVGGGYSFVTPLAVNPFTVSDYYPVPAFEVQPTHNVVTIQGSIFKATKVYGETDEAGVALLLTDTNALTYPSVTDADGNFTFFVPAGSYNLSIGGVYRFTTHPFAGAPLVVPLDAAQQAVLASPIEVSPIYVGQQMASVRGYAQDSGSTPIAGANLTLTNTNDPARVYAAITNAAGAFNFEVPAGNYSLAAVGKYQLATALAAFDTDPSGLHDLGAVTLNTTDIAMAKVQGQTVDSLSSAVAGVNLTLTDTLNPTQVFAAISNPNGEFSFEVPPGNYELTAVGRFILSPAQPAFAATSGSLNDLGPILVASTDIQMVKVQGYVQDAANNPIGGVNLTLTDTVDPTRVFAAISNDTGDFSFEVPPGNYDLTAVGRFALSPALPAFNTDPSGISNLGAVTVISTDVKMVKVLGQIFDAGGTAINGVNLTLTDPGDISKIFAAISNGAGNFSFDVPSGTYELSAVGKFVLTPSDPVFSTNDPGAVNDLGPLTVASTEIQMVEVIGQIQDAGGFNVEGVNLTLTDQSALSKVYTAITNAVGDFSFEVPSGTYQLAAVGRFVLSPSLPPFATNDASGINNLGIRTVASTGIPMVKVRGLVHDDGGLPVNGVNLTLTDQGDTTKVYSAITNVSGGYSFDIPSGTYILDVVGEFVLVGPNTSFATNDPTGINTRATITVRPDELLYLVSGTINKTSVVSGDPGPVKLLLRSTTISYETITNDNNQFSIKVKPGTYNLEITGLYEFATPVPGPVNATLADQNLGIIDVNPIDAMSGYISGTIIGAPINLPEPFEVRLWDQNNARYIAQTFSTASSGGHEYSFSEIPSGTYRVLAYPHKNGWFAETGASPINLSIGGNVSGHNLTAQAVAPNITGSSFRAGFPDILQLTGLRFSEAAPDPALTRIFIGGNRASRPSDTTLTTIFDEALTNSVAPGTHTAEIRRTWLYTPVGGSQESFVLNSNSIEFLKVVQPPSNLKFAEVSDTFAKISWLNAPWTQTTDIEIFNVTDGLTFDTYPDYQGSSLEIASFSANKTYEVRLWNEAGGTKSTMYSAQFTTKNNLYVDTALAGTSGLNSSEYIFGFEVINGATFIAAYNQTSYDVTVRKYASDGSTATGTMVFAGTSDISHYNWLSFTASQNRLYLQYLDSGGSAVVQSIDTNLSNFVSSPILPMNYNECQLIYANNRLYSLGTFYSAGSHTDIREYSSPETNLSASLTIVLDYFQISQTQPIMDQMRGTAIACDKFYLYTALASGPNYLISRHPFTNITASEAIGLSPASGGSNGQGIYQFAVGADQIVLSIEESAMMMRKDYVLNPNVGFFQGRDDLSDKISYTADSAGRVWMANYTDANRRTYIGLAPDLKTVQKSFKVAFFPHETGASPFLPFPNEFIKRDRFHGGLAMLYVDNLTNLKVYKLDPNYYY